MITIGTVRFDFVAENQPFIQSLYADWAHFFRTSFEEVADRVLTRYDNTDELIRIEALTVDMGTLTEEEFLDKFPRLFAEKLAEIFVTYLSNKEAHPDQISVISLSRSRLDRLMFYLLNGYLRWEEEEQSWSFPQAFRQALETDSQALCQFLRDNSGNTFLRDRLVLQLRDEMLEMLAVAILPSDNRFINPYVRFLIASHKRLERPEINTGDYRNAVWGIVLTGLLSQSRGYFSRKAFVADTLRELSVHYNIEFKTSQQSPSNAAPKPSSKQPPPHSQPDRPPLPPPDPITPTPLSRMHIYNSGLVLLSPYLPRLFAILKLTDESGNFNNAQSAAKAITAMQRLVYADCEFPEHELVLNKLLAGHEMSAPLPSFQPLTDQECAILLSLLNAATQNWEKLRNTTIEGFRTSFLQRDGMLEELHDRWILTVEPHAYDVLLDTLPWGYTPIARAWMKKPLHVNWR